MSDKSNEEKFSSGLAHKICLAFGRAGGTPAELNALAQSRKGVREMVALGRRENERRANPPILSSPWNIVLEIAEPVDPEQFFQLVVQKEGDRERGFEECILPAAKRIETQGHLRKKLARYRILHEAGDDDIRAILPSEHVFTASDFCACAAQMIRNWEGPGKLAERRKHQNFYVKGVNNEVFVAMIERRWGRTGWRVAVWPLGEIEKWDRDNQFWAPRE